MLPRDLVPRSAIGESLNSQFEEFFFRNNPSDSPMAIALRAHHYHVEDYPLEPKYTLTDWLASKVSMRGLSITFRQPNPALILICSIERESQEKKMKSPLLGVVEFISFCHYFCPGINYLGGCIGKVPEKAEVGNLKMERLISFYHRLCGHIEAYETEGLFWIYAEMRSETRFKTLPIWKRVQK